MGGFIIKVKKKSGIGRLMGVVKKICIVTCNSTGKRKEELVVFRDFVQLTERKSFQAGSEFFGWSILYKL